MLKFIPVRPFLLFALLLIGLQGLAQERFTDWVTEITPRPDRSIEVTETITVISEGDLVKRGITRSLPDTRSNPIRIESVERDGSKAAFHTEDDRGITTIYAGQRDEFLEPGSYTYRIRYVIENAIREQDGLEEMQVEIIGPDVSLPVESVRTVVYLPDSLSAVQYACYTGAGGASEKNCTMAAPNGGRLSFTGVGAFGNGEQLSVAVGFETGYFSAMEEAALVPEEPLSWWQEQGAIIFLILGSFAGLIYGYRSWRVHGVDPVPSHIGKVFTPPEDLSPAALNYLHFPWSTHSTEAFTATILFLATRGYISMEEEEEAGVFSTSYIYSLRAMDSAPPQSALTPEQRSVYEALFKNGRHIRLEEKYDQKFRKVAELHGEKVRETYSDRRSVQANTWKMLPLLGIYIATIVLTILLLKTDTTGYAMPAFLAFIILGAIGIGLYTWLIRKPSPELVRLRSEIAALREYLGSSESERKRMLNAPTMNEDHYEAMLPYAIALGINKKWSAYFGDLLTSRHYHPIWMAGGGVFHPHQFNNRFNQVVGASSTPPGSSGSGSSGGGSVGGGVGGGGAGGW